MSDEIQDNLTRNDSMKNNSLNNTACAELDSFIGIISCLPEQFTEKWIMMVENKQSSPTKVYGIENESFEDTLNRDIEIKSLSNLLKNVETPTVLAINSKWGTGKTTFINLWEKHLESDKEIETICFNAWKNDFAPDPLTAFLSEINPFFSKESKEADTNPHWEKAKRVGIYFSGKLIPIAAKTATAGLLDIDELSKFLKETGLEDTGIESELENLSKDLSKDVVNTYASHYIGYKASVSLIDTFKTNLEIAIAEKGKRLVIFVDELDRCRPTYAIELLERIKHLFDIKGLVFVLSLDKEQLSHSIKAVYGQDMDSEGYLKRFIDIEYRLKEPNPEQLELYIKSLFDQLNFHQQHNIIQNFVKVFLFLRKHYSDFSLREINQYIERVNIIIQLFDKEQSSSNKYFCYMIATLLIVREKNYEVYRDYIIPKNTPEKIIKHLNSTSYTSICNIDTQPSSKPPTKYGLDFADHVQMCTYLVYLKLKNHKLDEPTIQKLEIWYEEWSSRDNVEEKAFIKEFKDHFEKITDPNEGYEKHGGMSVLKDLDSIIDKIELSTQFS
ncbi:P-loop NTPase fold protein [Candidatus Albibeggiatoa sp. nov. BB20]|uniref:KAP family P-loop NTPase fold protein n=1 Tax=Candidatus Albibeggiatoa sp. nov. BB20 TaxID=3162723 RepID=UPI003365AAC4